MRPERFELPACCSGGNRSIQLSYGRTESPVYMDGRRSFNACIVRRGLWRCPVMAQSALAYAVNRDADYARRTISEVETGRSCWNYARFTSGRDARRHHHRPGRHDLLDRGHHLHLRLRHPRVRSWVEPHSH